MEQEPIVLGSEFAAAIAAERARLASNRPTPSPLSDKRYDFEGGEFNLTSVVEGPLDLEIQALVKGWRDSGAPERETARGYLSLDDNYTLIQFAKRIAVRALNQSSAEPCQLGLLALAMIDDSRIDPRDAEWAAGLLNYAARARPGQSANTYAEAIALATPGMGRILRDSEGGSTLEGWGFRERRTAQGIGLVRSGWAAYAPTRDLADVAERIGERALAERYVIEIEVATDLPSIWFDRGRREHAEEVLEEALGIVEITGTLRKSFGQHPNQLFVAWIAELPTPDLCAQLVADVGSGEMQPGKYATGVSVDRLFLLLVAGSARIGVDPYESQASVTAMAVRARAVLSELTESRSG